MRGRGCGCEGGREASGTGEEVGFRDGFGVRMCFAGSHWLPLCGQPVTAAGGGGSRWGDDSFGLCRGSLERGRLERQYCPDGTKCRPTVGWVAALRGW